MAKAMRKSATANAKRRAPPRPKFLDSITETDALEVLKVLARRNKSLAQEIEAVATELLSRVDFEELAGSVEMDLDSLRPEEVWDRAGTKRDGYVDSGDAAWQMFEETLTPYQEQMEKYRRLSMREQADLTGRGLLKGIYNFEKESSTEYKDWATDAPSQFFDRVLSDWKNIFGRRPPLSRMTKFLEAHCPDWADWATKSLRSQRP